MAASFHIPLGVNHYFLLHAGEEAPLSVTAEAPSDWRRSCLPSRKSAHASLKMSLSRIGQLTQKGSVLFLCDMQEKFRYNIVHFPQVVSVAARMLQAARVLELPVIVTEQYPQGLGPTVPELGADDLKKYSKTCFTMLTPEVESLLGTIPQLHSIILCGIETQACIMSTTLDLLERGLDVHVVADACSSRSQVDRLFALSRLKQSGAYITTSEGVILQLLRDAAHPKFKVVQKLIKEPAADSGLLSIFTSHTPLDT